jgi:dTDP-4-amino-4,6-dideoxygalactose transaminase
MEKLREEGIQTSIHYPGFWEFSAYSDNINKDEYPIASNISDAELTLPLFPTMTTAQIELVSERLKVALAGLS